MESVYSGFHFSNRLLVAAAGGPVENLCFELGSG